MRASKKVKGAVLLTAGAALFLGAPTVYAANGGDGGDGGNAGNSGSNVSSGNGGLLSGLQLLNNADVNVPATVCGVGAILALGSGDCDATAGGNSGGDGGDGGKASSSGKSSHSKKSSTARGGDGGNGGDGGSKGDNISRNNGGILSGLQVGNNLSANVPVTACGVGALLARGRGDCDVTAGDNSGGDGGKGGNASSSGKRSGGKAVGGDGGNGGDAGDKGDNISRNNDGILTGAQVLNNADLNVPITLCGVALLAASAGCSADVTAGGNGGGDGGNGGSARANGRGHGSGNAFGGDGGDGGNGGSKGDNVSANNDGILTGLQLLNNADLNVPVTVCGLAVLGAAGCDVDVVAGSRSGGDGGNGGSAITWTHKGGYDRDWDDDDDRDYRATVVRHATKLPHTGAAGLALIPFGLALVAGGIAMRRRAGAES